MKKFNILIEEISANLNKNDLTIYWESCDEFDVKLWDKPNTNDIFFISSKDSDLKFLERADAEEAEWIARNVHDELKSGMSFADATNKWIGIMLDQKSRLSSRW